MVYFISPLSIDAFTSPPNPTSLQYICSSLGLTYCSIYVLFILILPSICRINHVYNPHPPTSSYSHSTDTITHLINPSPPQYLSPNKGLPHPNITSTSVTMATHCQDMYIFPTAMFSVVQPWLFRTFHVTRSLCIIPGMFFV